MNIFKVHEEKVRIHASLKCPDGLSESLGFTLPDDMDNFSEFVNLYSKKKGYSITVEEENIKVICKKYLK